MESTYSTAKICDYDEDPETCVPSLELEPRKNNAIYTLLHTAREIIHLYWAVKMLIFLATWAEIKNPPKSKKITEREFL